MNINEVIGSIKDCKPCPFCGSKPQIVQFEDGRGWDKSWEVEIMCASCRVRFRDGLVEGRSPIASDPVKWEAANEKIVRNLVDKWNTRV